MSFPNAIYTDGAAAPIDAADTDQRYPLGQRMILEDGRVFAYAKVGVAITRLDLGLKNGLPQGVAQRSILTAVAKGGTSVTLECASPDGATANGEVVANEFEGGYILFFTGSGTTQKHQLRRVVSNGAKDSDGDVEFTFDRALSVDLTADHAAEVLASPYRHVLHDSNINFSVVGMPTCAATAGQFEWVQTWGVCWASPAATTAVGPDRGIIFRANGSLEKAGQTPTGDISSQYAGFCLAETSAGAQAAPFFMLQISP